MQIKNWMISVLYKCSIIVIIAIGIAIDFGLFDGQFRPKLINYFTTLSNLFCLVYFVCAVGWLIRGRKEKESTLTFCPVWKGMAILSISVTMIIAHVLLAQMFGQTGIHGVGVRLLHTYGPLLTIFDWILFDEKGHMKKSGPIWWLIPPYLYMIYAFIAGNIGDGIGQQSRYPYPFLDVQANGIAKEVVIIVVLTGIFLILGYVYYGIDHLLAKENSH